MYRQRKFVILFCLLPAIIASGISAQESTLKSATQAQFMLAERGEVIIRFVKPAEISVSDFTAFISIDQVQHDTITAYLNEAGYSEFLAMGIPFEVIDPPSVRKEKLLKSFEYARDVLYYPSYQEYQNIMEDFARLYPGLCKLEEFGRSVKNRSLLALKISDHPETNENEPVIFYSASMHGDEPLGYVLMLKLIDHLLSSYNTNNEIKELINHVEIWINPLANPDGAYYLSESSPEGATRFNANHMDLNRDFPDVTKSTDTRVRQKETLAMMDFMEKIGPNLSANFHSGAEVVNYPWDSWYDLHPDDLWYRSISRTFADTVHKYSTGDYMTDLDNGITNGYAWYKVTGSRQDYANYFIFSREVTIELSDEKFPAETELGTYWDYTKRSLVQYIAQSLTGITGNVTDSLSGKPVRAMVSILDHDNTKANSFVYSSLKGGLFYRLIGDGNYDLSISAPGYVYKNVSLDVQEGEMTQLNVRLSKESLHPNPFSEVLYFYIPYSGAELQITFTDISGRKVKYISHRVTASGRQEIPTGNLPAGFYIISVSCNGHDWILQGIRTNR